MTGTFSIQFENPSKMSQKSKVHQEIHHKEAVSVFCRIKPLDAYSDDGFTVVVNKCILKLIPPIQSYTFRNGNAKEHLFRFQHVFPPNSSQREVFDEVAKPLVSDLLNGKNGLLFAYGITGSGKTYTMQGTLRDGGLLSRTLDIIFNTINEYQTMKFIFKPDKMNGFEAQSEEDALIDKQKFDKMYSLSRGRKTNKVQNELRISQDFLNRTPDTSRLPNIDEDNGYCIFVNYIEIYNNYVYDLLEEFAETDMVKDLQSKILREDAKHNMYVHGCTEVEVKTPEEALEVLAKGQKKRKVAHTKLNCESSRSHSIFTIRMVQAPHDAQGENIITDRVSIAVSQLSLVDLAGSERNNRTRATGERVKEAGNINNSLMTLRQCIEVLRDNQQNCVKRKVPYRASKLTHYFKNYFEGDGKINMIVCVNPALENYDETLPVMKFAEAASEVVLNMPRTSVKPKLGLTPGRRKANKLFKETRQRLCDEESESEETYNAVCSLKSEFPLTEFKTKEEFEEVTQNLKLYFQKKLESRGKIISEINKEENSLREAIKKMEEENIYFRREHGTLKSRFRDAAKKLKLYEDKLLNAEAANDSLYRKFNHYNSLVKNYEKGSKERVSTKSQNQVDKRKPEIILKTKLEAEREKLAKEIRRKFKEQRNQLKNKSFVIQAKSLHDLSDSNQLLGKFESSSGEIFHSDQNLKTLGFSSIPADKNVSRRKRSLSQGDSASSFWNDHL